MKKKVINDPKLIRMQLAKLVATEKISSSKITAIAKSLSQAPYEIRRIDVCTHGFCCDFMISGNMGKALGSLAELKGGKFRYAESFPWGIIDDNVRHLRTTYEFDGFNPREAFVNRR